MYKNKFKMTPDQNRRYARSNFTELVHTDARFEGVNTTLPQTQTIIDGMSVTGVSISDTLVIVNLKKGWQLVTETTEPMSLPLEQQINKVVAMEDSLAPGEFRTGQGGVAIASSGYFEPDEVNIKAEQTFLTNLLHSDKTTTDKALTLLYHNMRGQLFWDGNKRTAMLSANKMMIDGGAGLISVPLDKWDDWNTLISDFYVSGDMELVKEWTYQNGIQGPDIFKL